MNRNKIFSAALFVLLIGAPVAAFASGYQSPDSIIKSAFEGNVGAIFSAARDLFMGLVGIEVVWFFANMVLNQREFYYVIQQALIKTITIGLYYKFLLVAGNGFSGGSWFYDLIHGMAGLGQSLGGSPATGDPSSIMNQGLTNALNILEAPMKAMAKNASWWNVFSNAAAAVTALELTIMVLPAAIGTLLAYALMSLRVFMIDVEMYFVLSAGILLLGTGGSRWTSSYARNYVNYVVSVSIRFFVIYFILGVCDKYVNNQTAALTKVVATIVSGKHEAGVFADLYSFAMDYFSIALLILMVPKFASALASGSSSAGVGDLLKPAATAAGVAALGAGAAGAATLAASKGALGAMNSAAGGTVGGGGGQTMSAIEAAAQYRPATGPNPPGFGAGGYVRDGGGGGSPSGSSGGGSTGSPGSGLSAGRGNATSPAQGGGSKPASGAPQGGSSRVTSGSGGPQVTSGKADDVAQGISSELATDAAEASSAATTGDAGSRTAEEQSTSAGPAAGAGQTAGGPGPQASRVTQGSGGGADLGSGAGSSKVSPGTGGSPSLGRGSGVSEVSSGSGGSSTLGSGSGASQVTTTGGAPAAPRPAPSTSAAPELTPNEKLQQSIESLRQSIEKMGQGKRPFKEQSGLEKAKTVGSKFLDKYQKTHQILQHMEPGESVNVNQGPSMGHLGSE